MQASHYLPVVSHPVNDYSSEHIFLYGIINCLEKAIL